MRRKLTAIAGMALVAALSVPAAAYAYEGMDPKPDPGKEAKPAPDKPAPDKPAPDQPKKEEKRSAAAGDATAPAGPAGPAQPAGTAGKKPEKKEEKK